MVLRYPYLFIKTLALAKRHKPSLHHFFDYSNFFGFYHWITFYHQITLCRFTSLSLFIASVHFHFLFALSFINFTFSFFYFNVYHFLNFHFHFFNLYESKYRFEKVKKQISIARGKVQQRSFSWF